MQQPHRHAETACIPGEVRRARLGPIDTLGSGETLAFTDNRIADAPLVEAPSLERDFAVGPIDRNPPGKRANEGDQTEACRCLNTAARLMSTFQDGLVTLQRRRTGGKQVVTVQHVNVESGAQAVINNVQTRGAKRRGSKSKDA